MTSGGFTFTTYTQPVINAPLGTAAVLRGVKTWYMIHFTEVGKRLTHYQWMRLFVQSALDRLQADECMVFTLFYGEQNGNILTFNYNRSTYSVSNTLLERFLDDTISIDNYKFDWSIQSYGVTTHKPAMVWQIVGSKKQYCLQLIHGNPARLSVEDWICEFVKVFPELKDMDGQFILNQGDYRNRTEESQFPTDLSITKSHIYNFNNDDVELICEPYVAVGPFDAGSLASSDYDCAMEIATCKSSEEIIEFLMMKRSDYSTFRRFFDERKIHTWRFGSDGKSHIHEILEVFLKIVGYSKADRAGMEYSFSIGTQEYVIENGFYDEMTLRLDPAFTAFITDKDRATMSLKALHSFKKMIGRLTNED